ncbi:MAG: hypothetical protein C4518_10485 [Desulfobacteraceae bacterium]|nr:MAG: hypothetical protein C4518_10485 [Desulfobacteraceae bacterium]
MSRPASGKDVLESARRSLLKARTVSELRQAQAMFLPLEFGLSMDQVAASIGVSKGWPVNCGDNSFDRVVRPSRKRVRGAAGDEKT